MNLSQSGDAAVPAMSAQSGFRVSMPHPTVQGLVAGEQRKYGTANDSDGSETATQSSVLQRLRSVAGGSQVHGSCSNAVVGNPDL